MLLILSTTPLCLMLSEFNSLKSGVMSSSSSITQPKYDVFLSFRGEDTRNNITSHLHKALVEKQIQTFIDYKLCRGDEISLSLLKAIEESHISVVIISKNYASSRWCLEELSKILDCKKRYGQIVIPVFYGIDPSDVRNLTGTIGDAFAKHEQGFKERLYKVQRWKVALTEVANLSGLHSSIIKPESLLIEDIVKDIIKRLNEISPSDNKDLVGIESRIKQVESLLDIGAKNILSVGICGIGGIGKTTLAEAVFNKVSSQFEGSYFIHNVREESEQSGGLYRLRRELLSAILGDINVNISTSLVGRTFIRNRLARKRILIIFDDVTHLSQIENLIGGLDCLSSKSRIIVTTRDKQVLNNCGVDHIYEVDELSYCDALELFSRYAFRQNHPIEDYMELSKKVAIYAGDVPLALKILGSFLLSKSKEVWESALLKLERIPHMDIQKVLKISFDELDDDIQNMFLDIACFFRGSKINHVKTFLDASGYLTEIGISALIDKSLITISCNMVTMHDMLQALGREIVRQECFGDPGKRSRLCHHDDIYHVLTKNTGAETIEGISLDMSKIIDIQLNPYVFSDMYKLRFLKFYGSSWYNENNNKVYAFEGLESDFTDLRYLSWYKCPLKTLSLSFHLENLVILEMRESKIEHLWSGVQHLRRLKEADLSFSEHLTSCPNLSGLPNLERLNLQGCTNLLEIPSSLRYLKKLEFLNLTFCKSLTSLPDCIGLTSLKKLLLRCCSSLKILPQMPPNIERLDLSGAVIENIPSSVAYLSRLVILDLGFCSSLGSHPSSICKWKSRNGTILVKFPDSIGTSESLKNLEAIQLGGLQFYTSSWLLPPLSGLHSLRELNLSDCNIIEIPDSLGHLSSLRKLDLSRNRIESIPASIINLSNLVQLRISNCKKLQFLPKLPMIRIDAFNCTSLEVLSCFSFQDSTVTISRPMFFQVNFINCLKLDRSILQDIVEDTLLKMQFLATLLKEEHFDKDSKAVNSSAGLCYPGAKISRWFIIQSRGSSINVELPTNWFNHNFVGFALSAVVAFRDDLCLGQYLKICCECRIRSKINFPDFVKEQGNLKFKDGHLHVVGGSFGDLPYYKINSIASHHVFVGFDLTMCPSELSCYDNEVSFKFYLEELFHRRTKLSPKIVKCGVRLMYAQHLGKSI